MDKRVGMIGVGLMGHGIANNIVSKGWQLGFLEHPGNQPTQDLLDKGAQSFTEMHELARGCQIIILCVSGTPEVEAIVLGDNGLLSAIAPDTIIIDCSTAVPSSTEGIARAVNAAGGRFMDAPMTRTPLEAEQGRLNLLIGGDRCVFDEVRPLLETFAENLFYAGPAGSGHKLKLLHNFVSLGFVTLLGEAAACAHKGGISAEVFVDVLSKGGGYGAALERVAPFILENDPSRMKFAVHNAHKDLSYYNTMAKDQTCPSNVASGVQAALSQLVDAGFGETYLSATAERFLEM